MPRQGVMHAPLISTHRPHGHTTSHHRTTASCSIAHFHLATMAAIGNNRICCACGSALQHVYLPASQHFRLLGDSFAHCTCHHRAIAKRRAGRHIGGQSLSLGRGTCRAVCGHSGRCQGDDTLRHRWRIFRTACLCPNS